jgi:hypothetical protein
MAKLLVETLERDKNERIEGRHTVGSPLCNFFKPMPLYLKAYIGHEDWGWYTWAAREWDTKWGDYDGNWSTAPSPSIGDPKGESETRVSYYFRSAWNPPIAVVAYIVSLGYEVHFSYYEGGMGFGGYTPPDGVKYSAPSYDADHNLVIQPLHLEEFDLSNQGSETDGEWWDWLERQGFHHAF